MMEMDAPSDQSLSSKKSQVGETVSIPVDLVIDILKRLPARDVLRSRSVCKEWNFLLRTPKFISLHYNHSLHMRHENAAHSSSFVYLRFLPPIPCFQTRPCHSMDPFPMSIALTFLTLEKTTTELVAKVNKEEDFIAMFSSLLFPSCPTISDIHHVQMICPFDGLICFGCAERVVMYNPATRESQLLPSNPELSSSVLSNYFINYIMGVWFESTVKQHYKVFRMVKSDFNSAMIHSAKIHIYDSTIKSWRVSPTIAGNVSYLPGLLFNGVFYFCMMRDSVPMIGTFDAKLETFGYLEMPPPSLTRPHLAFTLWPFRGNLAFMDQNFDSSTTVKFDLWVMTEYGVQQSWTHKFCVPLDFPIFGTGYRSPLAIWDYEDDQGEFLVQTQDGTVSVNLNTGKETNLKLLYTLPPCSNEIAIIPCNVESLLSLK